MVGKWAEMSGMITMPTMTLLTLGVSGDEAYATAAELRQGRRTARHTSRSGSGSSQGCPPVHLCLVERLHHASAADNTALQQGDGNE
jgi:hypothetical protein